MTTAKTTAKTADAFAADMQKTLTENVDKAAKSFEGVAQFGQETVDALIRSQNIAAKAVEEFNAEVIAFSKKNVEESVAHAKELASAQTVTEFIEKQAGFARAMLDSGLRQATRLNELAIAAARESFEPLNARATAAADLVKRQTA